MNPVIARPQSRQSKRLSNRLGALRVRTNQEHVWTIARSLTDEPHGYIVTCRRVANIIMTHARIGQAISTLVSVAR
jgi:hypothetical protein